MNNKLFSYVAVAAIVLSIVSIGLHFGSNTLAGTTNYDALDVTDGYSVDGTTVIDGSGNVDAPITSTTGTFSTSVTAGSNGTA